MKMVKKFLGLFLILSLLFHTIIAPTLVKAVDTNGLSTPWTLEKAEHLAKRALIGPNNDIIKTLYNAGSSQAAVNILFPSVAGPDRTAYEAEGEQFKKTNFSPTDTGQMRRYYAFQYLRDPYEAKKKFFGLFEDIFPVDRKDDILFTDIENHFDILYDETLGNYKRMMKRVLFDVSKSEGSFAMGKYLDLLNQPNKNAPNENYAREMLQLFLMGEYKPWEDAETPGSVRNYTEEDVFSFARLITGFRAEMDKKVYFDPAFHNTGTGIAFLTGSLKSGTSFPFYDATTGLIDNTLTFQSLGGNNGLGDNMVDYVFAKREAEISYFLSWRMLKFYVQDTPSETDIKILANQLIINNFELYPTVKWLLSSDLMYSQDAMNLPRYKNPIELAIGTLKLLTYKHPEKYNNLVVDTNLLSTLEWFPYSPFSIFGRPGFDKNENFFNPYMHNQWVTYANKIAFETNAGSGMTYMLSDLISENRIEQNSGMMDIFSHTGNTYSGSVVIENIHLTLVQDFQTENSIQPASELLKESIPVVEVLSNIESEIGEVMVGSEISISGETIPEIPEEVPEMIPEMELIPEISQPVLSTGSATGEIIIESIMPGELPLPEDRVSVPEMPIGEEIVPEILPSELEMISETPESIIPAEDQDQTQKLRIEPLAIELPGKDISLSGSFVFPSFRISTQSGGIINFSGSIDFSESQLLISGGTFSFSGKIYDIASGRVEIAPGSMISRDITPDEMLTQLENYFYFGKSLPESVRSQMIQFLTQDHLGNQRVFLPNNTTFQNKYIKALISMMLIQPEYLMLSGYDTPTENGENGSSLIPNSQSKLIMVELFGGYDWLNAVVPKTEYNTTYQTTRAGMTHSLDNLIDVGDYYLNKSYEPFLPFIESGEAKIVNRVGAPNHSRGHDTAAIQIASKNALQTFRTPGVIGDLAKSEIDASKHIVLGSSKPNVYTNGRYLNIGGNSVLYKNNFGSQTSDEKLYQIHTTKNILKERSYPGHTKELFQNSLTVDKVGSDSKASGGQEGSGNNTKQRLAFLGSLINNNVGVTYYIPGGGGYDTHGDQEKIGSYNLNDRTADLSKDIAEFFTTMKAQNKDVTIVIFSEFGRTLKTNGTIGTDHGQGGGMFILSTNPNLKSQLPGPVVGKLSVENEFHDWFGVGIDYRAIYGKILTALYHISPEQYFGGKYNLEDYLNTQLPNPVLFRHELRNGGGSSYGVDFKFKVDDANFIFDEAAYMDFYFGDTQETLRQESRYHIANNSWQKIENSFKISKNLNENRTYHYSLVLRDNQYDTYTLTGSITTPKKTAANASQKINLSGDNFFPKYANTQIVGEKIIDKIVLFETENETTGSGNTSSGETFTGSLETTFTGGISMKFGTGETSISKLTSSGELSWNGGFLIPKEINPKTFLTKESKYQGIALQNYYIDKIVKVGADILGVGMELSQNIVLGVPVNNLSKKYRVLRSEDGIHWTDISGADIAPINGKIEFLTNHFTFFALVESGVPVIPEVPITPPTIPPEIPTSPPITNNLGGGGGSGLRMDRCANGDLSPSYYDNTCEMIIENIPKKSQEMRHTTLRYQGVEVMQIKGYKTSKNALKMSMSIIANKSLKKSEKEILVKRINEFLMAKYNYDTQTQNREILKSQYNKQTLLLKSAMNRIIKN